ncbi:TIR domain-containing protein [Janthinobacterium sp. GMG2]|uniref:TIR domain-containing protein n=1 Tax=Janthinobacterium sp. GMG2 TaxID=3096606 RepID=UPI0029F51A83|nr:TIR domain-containing protein [Janthinobacterium sp. GMG2]MDX8124218.1 TIR domain-containing protein [Janthinobacterium sp. GMG2]
MAKAFLSHNSFDKDFVERVFNELGSGRCVYDKDTFKKNSDLALQIREGLENSEIYVLFLSKSALSSKWVSSELDLAQELKIKWQIRQIMVFVLDDTSWDSLPAWMGRYVISCPPSPHHVALRILDEIQSASNDDDSCWGRAEEEREIVSQLSDLDVEPAFLYFSGPNGIGRKTLADAVYKSYYPGIGRNKIKIKVDITDGVIDIYRKALAYSANWRASELREEMDRLAKLSPKEKAKELAILIFRITTKFNQVLILDAGPAILNEEGVPQPWFLDLINNLELSHYPYLLFLSTRFYNGGTINNGVFVGVEPLEEKWSVHLFRVLIKKHKIELPSKSEQQLIENSIVGHPGLITMVANYLRRNPNYKPNKTHNNIVKLINEQVQMLLADFINGDKNRELAVAFIAETDILSYEEINLISESWKDFGEATSALQDAGLLLRNAGDYSLAIYVQRYASGLASRNREALAAPRKILLSAYDTIKEDSFVSIQLLNSRIIEHIIDGKPIESYLSNLIMPIQQIKAARRRYDVQDYDKSLSLAKSAYEQSDKLSDSGKVEAWRLIGLSAVRKEEESDFVYFEKEYRKFKRSDHIDAIYNFGHGFKYRIQGNLRSALMWFKKIKDRYADHHLYRELAYIYAFEKEYAQAYAYVQKAHQLAIGNPYILDIWAMILLDRYRIERRHATIPDIDKCLDELRAADQRDGTSFYFSRSKIRDVIIDNDLISLEELFKNRRNLPISAKTALLNTLSLKNKNYQYDELLGELRKYIKEKKNALAKIEIARIHIEHLVLSENYPEAEKILDENKENFTELCCQYLARQFPVKRKTGG